MLALKRMALLSKGDSSVALTSPQQGEAHAVFNYFISTILISWFKPAHLSSSLVLLSLLDLALSPEAEHALQSLERKMQGPPQFTQSLEDQTVAQGSSVHLECYLTGTHPLFI